MVLMVEEYPTVDYFGESDLICPVCGSEDVDECNCCGAVRCYSCGRIKASIDEFLDIIGEII